jgi:hypothetical protein
MREYKVFIYAALLSVIAFLSPTFAYDFVPVNEADVLVITHQQLRTPNWPDIREGAWETQLLEQKAAQGFNVAILQIGDGFDQYFIRNYLVNHQGSFCFVLIIGDARRDYDNDPPNPMTVLPANFNNGNIVPIWREVIENQWYWPPNYANICESDQGYIAGIPNVSIGRIPAESRQEILDYLSKSDQYLAEQDPSWSHRILEVLDDVFHAYNLGCGLLVQDYTDACEPEFASGWPVTRLATSTASTDTSVREMILEDEFKSNTPGVIHVLGTSGRADDLVNWYFGDSPYNFTNTDHFPLMLAMSCDIGGFDQYANGAQRECVLEKLVLMPGGGLIGAVSATGWTLQTIDGVYSIYFWRTIFSEGVWNFGQIVNRSIELTMGKVPPEDFVLHMVTLLGDPTLSLPFGNSGNFPPAGQDTIITIFPNPSNATARIRYAVPVEGKVKLTVYDVLGREVAVLVDGIQSAGTQNVTFNGTSFASGVYFVRMSGTWGATTRKMLLLK